MMLNKTSRRFQAIVLSPTSSTLLLHSTYHTSSYINNKTNNQSTTTTIVESYSERQAKKGRFVSPHLTIYKFPIAALSSITNRVTGVLLTVGNKLINKKNC